MKYTHITKAIAVVMTMIMLLSCVPSSVLPVFAADAQQSTSIFDNVTLGKGTVANNESYMAHAEAFRELYPNVTDAAINAMVDSQLSPYEPYATTNEDHPFLPGGSANIDLSQIFYGAPATQNYPLTKWAANTSVYNIHQHNGEYAFKDLDLIDGFLWNSYAADSRLPGEKGTVGIESKQDGNDIVTSKDGEAAFVYNRFDAMQGKYGITLDRNVSMVRWSPSYYGSYYKTKDVATDTTALVNSVLYLSDTPYLYFSTEALDTTKMAISLLIGTQVQKETGAVDGATYSKPTAYYEYRWYTITDNAKRPGIGTDTLDYSMIPNVTISEPVAVVLAENGETWLAGNQQSSDVVAELTGDKADPLALAGATKAETMYVDGSITGCIDFTNILPLIYPNATIGMDDKGNLSSSGNGRFGIQYKIAQIRVDTKTAEGEGVYDSASRINYLYFGPSLATVFAPQNIVGNERDANSYLYKQTSTDSVGVDEAVGAKAGTSDDRAYVNGWENGKAVSLTNTPNDPQKLTVDIYGKGDGQLIEWSAVPSGANVLKGNQKEGDSKVWKFTDKNGNVQYMEAQLNTVEHSGIDDSYYVMVTVPVRKWVNVLGDSRKISLTATLLHEGTQYPTAHLKPTFVLWGNYIGSIGAGHQGPSNGTRHHGEGLVMVFATDGQTYHSDQGQDYVAAQVDRTVGDSLIYNTGSDKEESWFDVLRSPYTYDEAVKSTNNDKKITGAMVGYTYITSLRFAMPVGSAIQIQNMKGDNNSAGLNMYSTSGSIVSAYDGGTGEQPNIDVTSTVPQYQMSYNSTTKQFSSTKMSTDIKGNITSGSAAYGPMLRESRYTIYDLLDTEMLRATGNDSHDAGQEGKAKQPVYGEVWKANQDLPIYHTASTTGQKYGYVYGGSHFTIYATVIREDSGDKYGLVGVLTKNGGTELGWVKIYDKASNKSNYASRISGVLYLQNVTAANADAANSYRYTVMAGLVNNWTLGNFGTIANNADFRDLDNVNFEYTADFRNNSTNTAYASLTGIEDYPYNPGQDVVAQTYGGGPQLKYANMWTDEYHYNSGYSLQDFYLRSINGTDMEWGFERAVNTTNNLSMSMTRAFKNPIRLKKGQENQGNSYPVLYVDYTSNIDIKLGISLRVDGYDKIWFVDDTYMSPEDSSLDAGEHFAYLSFEDMMTKDFKDANLIEVTGLSMVMWAGTSVNSANAVIRRCEIWQEEIEWYDEIISANQHLGGNTSTQMNDVVKDSMNIINDSYFNAHSETLDGEIAVTKKGTYADGTNIGINNANKGNEYTYTDNTQQTYMDYWQNNVHYQYYRTESYHKNNSNKGWKAYIRIDENADGTLDTKDPTYYSYDENTGARRYEVDGVYQYMTSVGHLRVWVPSGTQTQVVFEADRSFNTSNYKYLYYSYSMRDSDTGISAEEPDTDRDDGKKPGVAVAIKQTQLGSANSYSEIVDANGNRTWAYYPAGHAYWTGNDQDNRTFKTTINAAADLSTFTGLNSVNQFVFYLNNPLGTKGDGNKAEFYINYLYLSNVAPEDLIADKLEEETYQYYYLMDNTGGRYSARFPTLDNPTGQVTGQTVATDRVNPVIIKRGDRLNQGTYFNGQPLQSYVGYESGNTYDKTGDGATGSMKDIMFYSGTGGDDITGYYEYKKTGTKDTKGDINDMKWSYGRWDTGTGESGLNTMYIGQKNDATLAEAEGQISGRLVRRYATENYVLLRAGIQPKMYTTYYDANGGEFLYDTSPDYIENLEQVTENNYYVTNDYVQEYFKHPASRNSMKGDQGKITDCLVKPGYKFSHWEHYTNYGTVDTNFNPNADSGKKSHLVTYIKKQNTGDNYFKAVWEADYTTWPQATEYTATFQDTKGGTFRTVTVGEEKTIQYPSSTYTRKDRFVMTIPNATILYSGHQKVNVYGWTIKDDTSGRVYSPGQKIYLLENTTFLPVTKASEGNTFTITLVNAELWIPNENEILRPAEFFGATLKQSGTTYVYSNVPENYKLVAKPVTAKSGSGWSASFDSQQNKKLSVVGETATVLSSNYQQYTFTAHENITITYGTLANATFYENQNNVYVTTSPRLTTDAMNQPAVYFTSQFALPSGCTYLGAGTLLTKDTYYNTYGNTVDSKMRIDMSTLQTEADVTNRTYKAVDSKGVRPVPATTYSSNFEYTAYIGHTKPETITYYARAYVIYKYNDTIKVAYSDVVAYNEGSYTTTAEEL